MPIHDVGYREWKGQLTAAWSRWWTISEIGIRTAFSSRWIRRIVLASWFPVVYFGVVFFILERSMMMTPADLARQFGGESAEMITEGVGDENINNLVPEDTSYQLQKRAITSSPWITALPNGDALMQAIESGDKSTLRRTMWSYFLSTFLQYSQGMMTLMIVGLIVPPLISRDVRSRAFLLYYSRPITRFEYLLGKIAIPGFVLLMVTFAPAIVLYFLGLMLSPDLSVVVDTWDLPIRIGLATLACVVPTCLIGLLFSAMTQESRFAGFGWFTVWGLGAVVWFGIYISNSTDGVPFESNWSLISIYTTIGKVQSWVFGLETDFSSVLPSIIALVLLSLFSFIMLYRRISAPIRI